VTGTGMTVSRRTLGSIVTPHICHKPALLNPSALADCCGSPGAARSSRPDGIAHYVGPDHNERAALRLCLRSSAETHSSAADRAVEMARSWKANLDPPVRTSASRAPPVQVLIVGQTSSNRSKTTPVSSQNVKPIAVH
jgi:hypothetical protein